MDETPEPASEGAIARELKVSSEEEKRSGPPIVEAWSGTALRVP